MPALQNVFNDLKTDLKIDWATHEAAKHAVENWHYSEVLPVPPLVKVGSWEDGKFIGVVIFSRGANNNLLKPFGLSCVEGCELTRVALTSHKTQVSRIIKMAMMFLKKNSPSLRLIVSFADPSEGHHGGIYQAGNWIYTGKQPDSSEYLAPDGKTWHGRMIKAKGWTTCHGVRRKTWKPNQCAKIIKPGKHRYLMPLDPEMRKQILPLSKPYPKRAVKQPVDCAPTNGIASLGAGTHPEKPKRAASETVDTPPDQGGKGGSIPTAALHS